MKNKFSVLIVGFVIVMFSIYILPTISFFNSSALGPENVFVTGEWYAANTTTQLVHLEKKYSNQESITSYVDESGDHFQIEIDTFRPQFLSFVYKLESEETAQLFDSPSVILEIGGMSVLQIESPTYDDQWHETFVDLSNFNLNSGIHNINFITLNTYDDLNPLNFQVKQLTTTKLFNTNTDMLIFTLNKPVKSLVVSHKVLTNHQEETIQKKLETQENDTFSYALPPDFFGEELLFWSEDFFGNIESTQLLKIEHALGLGASQCFTQVFQESDQEISTQIKYFNENEIAKYFDARVSQNQIITEQDWNKAFKLLQKQFHEYLKDGVPIQAQVEEIQNNLVFENHATNQINLTIKLCNVLGICDFCIQNHPL